MRRSALVLMLAVVVAPALATARPFTPGDLVAMERISDPQPSPDGTRVAFVVTAMDLEKNGGRKDIWISDLDGGHLTRLTTDPANDWAPRWADGSTLYFLSSRSGSDQVWRLKLTGGEAERITDLPLDVGALVVGPARAALYLGLAVFPDCEDTIQCTVDRLDHRAHAKASGKIFDRLFVRHWDTWEDGRRNHVFRLPLHADGLTAGDPVDLMAGVDANCPTAPWGDEGDFSVSPDGRWMVYTAKVVPGSEQAWSTNYDLWAVPTDGSAAARCLTKANPAWDGSPRFSPDGHTLAWLAMARPGYESDRFRVTTMHWPDGPATTLTESWDRSPASLVWSVNGRFLLATADNVGNHSLFRIDAATGDVAALVTRHSNTDPRPLPSGGVLFLQDSLISPAEVMVMAAPGQDARKVTDLNRRHLADLDFGKYRQFSFIGAHGDEVWGYLIQPVDFDPKGSYPLAFLIHGGPQGSFDDHWHYRWNPEVYAAHGYAVVTIDFHGSTGYGQDFTDAINGDWGGAPFEDLMKGLDSVLASNRWIDPERMAAAGASFGGYMINWIQGHTDRFKALVCHDGNLDELMAYYDTEELWFPEWEHGGPPWVNPEGYRKDSPVNFVGNWKTPELVIHGNRDYRVVDTQGIGTFNALQRLGIPSRLLYFPDESHWVLKPQNSLQWHEVVLDWMDRWTRGGS
jgi:dipeptidyl aminopeptidase/acylaminoacyl peptidase